MTASNPPPDLNELAGAPVDEVDVALLAQLARAYEHLDPVPSGLVDRIAFAVTLHELHAEIAELQRAGMPVGVRAVDATDAQTVTFTSSTLTTMVTITTTSTESVRVDGWVAPGARVSVELRRRAGSLHTTTDADGRFVFESVPRGMAQFVLRREPAAVHNPVITPSIEL